MAEKDKIIELLVMGRVWKKVGFGPVRVYPNCQMLSSGISSIEKSRVQAGNFGLGYTQTHN